jgi:hypothetical protein
MKLMNPLFYHLLIEFTLDEGDILAQTWITNRNSAPRYGSLTLGKYAAVPGFGSIAILEKNSLPLFPPIKKVPIWKTYQNRKSDEGYPRFSINRK